MPNRHSPHRFTSAQEGPDNVGCEYPLEPRRIHFVHAHLTLERGGVIHQRRDPAEVQVHGFKYPHHIQLRTHVAWCGNGAAALRVKPTTNSAGFTFPAHNDYTPPPTS